MKKSDISNEAREADHAYSRAAKAELARDYDTAYKLYIKATELYLGMNRSALARDQDKVKWKASASKALERAEKVKSFVERQRNLTTPTSGATSQPVTQLTPVIINHFSIHEQSYVLGKGKQINGLTFQPWDDPSPTLKQDCKQPKFSPEQEQASAVWHRFSVSTETLTESTNINDLSMVNARQILPQEIMQHVVTDCSVCASISVCLEHSRRFGSRLAQSSVHGPVILDRSNGGPSSELEQSRHYHLKLFFNGQWRRVVVDDYLPYDPVSETLMCMSVIGGSEEDKASALWPSILEKGYIKLMGGYDFPGSNSSIDLHTITGWIPEHLEITRANFERETTWRRIHDGFSSGDCVLTLGTGPTRVLWREFFFLESHSYAIVDVSETDGQRSITVLDPWIHPGQGGDENGSSRILTIPWFDVLAVFHGIYVNWNPATWQKTLTFHGMWKRAGEDELSSMRQVRLNFSRASLNEGEEIWVLLTRHAVDTRRTSDFISLTVKMEDESTVETTFREGISLNTKGSYTNSTHILHRARLPPSLPSGVLNIHASYEGQSDEEVGFTLAAYAIQGTHVSWDARVPPPSFTKKIEGSLTTRNSGGNYTYPTFMLNPQWKLQIHAPNKITRNPLGREEKAQVRVTVQTGKDLPVNVAIAWSNGQRITELPEKEVIATSGAYSYGSARLQTPLSAGTYALILSAFEPHHTGKYSLRVDSSLPCDLIPIPPEGAGMYTTVVSGSWQRGTAGGGPSSPSHFKNPKYAIDMPTSGSLKIRLQFATPTPGTAINVTVYPAGSGDDPHTTRNKANIIMTSGAYDDALSGVATPLVHLNPGRYWAVVSTYNAGVEAGFKLIVYASVGGVDVRLA